MEYKKTKFIHERQKFQRIYIIMKTILISGGQGKFAQAIKKVNSKYKIISPDKNEMNIYGIKNLCLEILLCNAFFAWLNDQ